MSEATWSGLFLMAIKPQGQDVAAKEAEYNQVVKNMVRGGPNVLLEDPDNVKFHNVDFAPKVNEFVQLTEAMLKYCVATTGLPHSMFYDEEASNRATMIGKIQLATSTVINPMREWIGRAIIFLVVSLMVYHDILSISVHKSKFFQYLLPDYLPLRLVILA